jgi:hypothetical protein
MILLLPSILHSISLAMGLVIWTQSDFKGETRIHALDRYIILGPAVCVIAVIYNFQSVGWRVTLAIVVPAALMAFGVAMLPPRVRRIIRRVAMVGFVFFFVATCVFWRAVLS